MQLVDLFREMRVQLLSERVCARL